MLETGVHRFRNKNALRARYPEAIIERWFKYYGWVQPTKWAWMAVTLLQERSNVTKMNSMHECMSRWRKCYHQLDFGGEAEAECTHCGKFQVLLSSSILFALQPSSPSPTHMRSSVSSRTLASFPLRKFGCTNTGAPLFIHLPTTSAILAIHAANWSVVFMKPVGVRHGLKGQKYGSSCISLPHVCPRCKGNRC